MFFVQVKEETRKHDYTNLLLDDELESGLEVAPFESGASARTIFNLHLPLTLFFPNESANGAGAKREKLRNGKRDRAPGAVSSFTENTDDMWEKERYKQQLNQSEEETSLQLSTNLSSDSVLCCSHSSPTEIAVDGGMLQWECANLSLSPATGFIL